jgi:hypothetical protein
MMMIINMTVILDFVHRLEFFQAQCFEKIDVSNLSSRDPTQLVPKKVLSCLLFRTIVRYVETDGSYGYKRRPAASCCGHVLCLLKMLSLVEMKVSGSEHEHTLLTRIKQCLKRGLIVVP